MRSQFHEKHTKKEDQSTPFLSHTCSRSWSSLCSAVTKLFPRLDGSNVSAAHCVDVCMACGGYGAVDNAFNTFSSLEYCRLLPQEKLCFSLHQRSQNRAYYIVRRIARSGFFACLLLGFHDEPSRTPRPVNIDKLNSSDHSQRERFSTRAFTAQENAQQKEKATFTQNPRVRFFHDDKLSYPVCVACEWWQNSPCY